MFERYQNAAALGTHGKTAEFKAMFRGTGKFLQGRKTVLSEWAEEDGAFVRAPRAAKKAKL
jgi:quinol monooxygenase YgiN